VPRQSQQTSGEWLMAMSNEVMAKLYFSSRSVSTGKNAFALTLKFGCKSAIVWGYFDEKMWANRD